MITRSHFPAVRPRSGFTLIELLTVVAIVGVLAAIVIPTTQGARNSALRARTRVQFSQWVAACEVFRQEYGSYPQVTNEGASYLVNDGAVSDPAGRHPFHDLLAGRRRDGSSPVESLSVTNSPTTTKGVRFFTFADSDFVTAADIAAGHNSAGELNLLRDAFHNTAIAVVIDANFDGIINAEDAPAGLPYVRVPGSGLALRPVALEGAGRRMGIHAGVAFYSAPPGATSEEHLVVSWR